MPRPEEQQEAQDLICAAIEARRILSLSYSGTMRRVEPHLLGYDAEGHLTLSAWQREGTGEGWRDFHLGKVTGLAATDESFRGARASFNPRDDTIDRVICRIT